MVHLSSRQLASLILPFVVTFAVYIYSAEIISYANYLFPAKEKYSNMDIDAKIDTYLQIQREIKTYGDVQQKVDAREGDTKWVANNLLYEKQQSPDTVLVKQSDTEDLSYKLQALFYDNKTAIINNLIVKEGSLIGESVVTKIEKNRVQIKTKKGLKWLTIFH